MRLAIADPPYLGRARYYDGSDRPKYHGKGRMGKSADAHPNAGAWDDPATHKGLIADLAAYDGWAIAMSRDSLPLYLSCAPTARVAVWHNPAAWPPGNRIHATWEPVLLHIPEPRRAGPPSVKDVLISVPPRRSGFIGAKPPAWTRWVLDMLGYDPETDTVDDLFGGSGAVTAEINQGVLL